MCEDRKEGRKEGREEPLKAPSRPTNVGDGECEGREKEGGRDGIDV